MDEERGSTGESYPFVKRNELNEIVSEDKVAFKDDFAQALVWDAGQYHEEDNYLDIDLS